MACWDSLLVDGVDVQTYGGITSAAGLLSTGPFRADIIEQDWVPGAIVQIGPPTTYSFEVPLLMNSDVQDVALGQLRQIQSWQGTVHTLTRRLTVNGQQISETCQAIMVSAQQVVWDFKTRKNITAVMVWQNLSGKWA